ncbi:MAG: ABC transporter permease [Acidobacteria bacterium]|nr:ABC transporter permease [Acidobacteriota bacterium]
MISPRLAWRSLKKTPLVTSAAVLSLALGIGANAAIFSVFEQAVLRPVPVEDPGRLVNLLAPGPKPGSQSTSTAGDIDAVFSYPMFRDLETSFAVGPGAAVSGLAAHRNFSANLARSGDTINGEGLFVSGGYFGLLGLRPTVGRLIRLEDDRVPGAHQVVVLSFDYWRDRFGTDPAVVGETLLVNGLPMTILGVAPRGFRGTTLGVDPKVFVPLSMREALLPLWKGWNERNSYWVYLFGRLAPGATIAQAAAALNVPYQGILNEVELDLQEGMSEATQARFAAKEIVVEAGRRGQSNFRGKTGPPLTLLLCVTGAVLFIACANLANLLLVQTSRRASEIAVRLSLGARRHQLVAQLMTESLLLAALGTILGVGVAYGTLKLLASILPSDGALELSLSPAAWVALGLMGVLVGSVGLLPALRSTRVGLAASLKGQDGRTSGARGANRFRAALVTLQIAFSLTLLISACLFTRSLLKVGRVELGLEVSSVATFGLSPELNRYTPDESRRFFQRLEEEISALPGVSGVGASLVPLIAGSNWGSSVTVQGFEAGPDTDTHSQLNIVGPGFFRTLGIPLLAGRAFEDRDDMDAPKVAIVNEAFARKFNLGRDAVGKRMSNGMSDGTLDFEIVGLVPDTHYSEVKQAVPPTFFLPYRQNENLGSMNFYVRAKGDPQLILPTLRDAVAQLDPNLPVEGLQTFAYKVRDNITLDRVLSVLSASLAVLATLLAVIGLYGVMAYTVAQRTREIGLRMALGADGARVRRWVLGSVGWMTLIGGVIGVVAALGLGRAAGSLLFEMEGHDPLAFTLSVLLLTTVAFSAGLLPAQRASRIEPMQALRDE